MIPKRAISALVTTVFALALLLSFRTPEGPTLAASTSSGTAIVGEPTPGSGSTAAPTVPPTGDAPTTATTPPSTPAATAASGSAYVDGTVDGPVVSTRFGNIQVEVTVAGGVLTDVTALQLPQGDRHSARISQLAEPLLRESALSAQSGNIDLLSGATFTSRAYAQSLQAALDKARA